MLSKSYSRRIWKTALLTLVDFISILTGSAIIYLIRYRWLDNNFFGFNLGAKMIYGRDCAFWSIILACFAILVYIFLGLYEVNKRFRFWRTIFSLGFGVFVVLLGLITYFFFYEYNTTIFPQGIPVSRFILATGGFVVMFFVLFARSVIWASEQILFHPGFGKIDIVVIGDKKNYLSNFLENRQDIAKILNYQLLNEEDYENIKFLAEQGNIAEIYLFSGVSDLEYKLALLAERYKISFIFSPIGMKNYEAYDLRPVSIGQKVFLELRHTRLDGWQVVLKRLFDIVFALSFMLLFSWLYLIVMIAIKLDSEGPVFYGSKRVGPNGQEFTLWKFRRLKKEYCISDKNTTALEVEQELIKTKDMRGDGILYKIKDDSRTTRVGRLIEKFSIDELPQFFNVLIGNMSVVGPRPHQLREVAKYSSHHFKVLNIKPGITGMAQVNGRSDLTLDQEVEFDTYYVENWHFWLDLEIILKTPISIIKPHRS